MDLGKQLDLPVSAIKAAQTDDGVDHLKIMELVFKQHGTFEQALACGVHKRTFDADFATFKAQQLASEKAQFDAWFERAGFPRCESRILIEVLTCLYPDFGENTKSVMEDINEWKTLQSIAKARSSSVLMELQAAWETISPTEREHIMRATPLLRHFLPDTLRFLRPLIYGLNTQLNTQRFLSALNAVLRKQLNHILDSFMDKPEYVMCFRWHGDDLIRIYFEKKKPELSYLHFYGDKCIAFLI